MSDLGTVRGTHPDGGPAVTYDVLVQTDLGGCYEWDITALLRDPASGALYIASDSGCSCNYFGEDPVEPTGPYQSWQDAVEAAREHFFDDVKHAQFAEDVMRYMRAEATP